MSTDPHRDRLARMARAAGYVLVPIDQHQVDDAISAVCITEARRYRAALVEIREHLAHPSVGQWAAARRVIDETLNPAADRLVPNTPPPPTIVREVIVDHSPPA